KNYHFDKSYTLVGIGPYSQLCFMVSDVNELNKLKAEWLLTKKGTQIFDTSPVSVYLLKNKTFEKLWTISPRYENISIDGQEYFFSYQLLKELATKFHLNYIQRTDTLCFKNELPAFVEKCRKNPKFIFLLEPNLKYDGKFYVSFKTDKKINSPAIAIELLDKRLSKIASTKDYDLIYEPFNSDINDINDQSRITITVECRKSVYHKLKKEDSATSSWKASVITVESYWKK
ncbi:MAG: hypothetical protein ACJ749_14060, partial [Flavisolibacter sp.]